MILQRKIPGPSLPESTKKKRKVKEIDQVPNQNLETVKEKIRKKVKNINLKKVEDLDQDQILEEENLENTDQEDQDPDHKEDIEKDLIVEEDLILVQEAPAKAQI